MNAGTKQMAGNDEEGMMGKRKGGRDRMDKRMERDEGEKEGKKWDRRGGKEEGSMA